MKTGFPSHRSGSITGGMELLLIEDDEVLGDAIRTGLSQEGYAVGWEREGNQAARALKERPYDLVLLDLQLPGRAGLDLLKATRSHGNPTPVLIITARDTTTDLVRGLDAGADDYLVKPFDLDELYARVRALLRRTSGAHISVLRHGDLTLDLATHTAVLRGASIDLSPREFVVLRLLIESTGKVLSRKRLEEALYGWDHNLGSNAVEVHVHHLRRKLGPDFIHTLRGVGYLVPRFES
jgi:two-component system, OmpR family, response regulator QseB